MGIIGDEGRASSASFSVLLGAVNSICGRQLGDVVAREEGE